MNLKALGRESAAELGHSSALLGPYQAEQLLPALRFSASSSV